MEGNILQTYDGHRYNLNGIAFAPNSKFFATGSIDYNAKLWSIDGGLIHTYKGHRDGLRSLAFSPDGKLLLTGSYDARMKLWMMPAVFLEQGVHHFPMKELEKMESCSIL